MPVRLPTALAPLRHRQFAAFWLAAFISNIGTWMESVSVGAYVTAATDSALWAGLVAAAAFLPTGLLGPVGGAMADRYDRRHILLCTNALNLAVAATLTVLFVGGEPSPGLVTSLVLVAGLSFALGFPSYQALLPDLVPREDLMGAIGLSSSQWNLGRVIGPALAGLVLTTGGVAWALGVNTVTFLAPMAVLLWLKLPKRLPHDGVALLRAIGDGARFAWREPGIRVALQLMFVNTLLIAPFIGLVPAMATKEFGLPDRGTAILVTAQGVGAVLAGLAVGPLGARYGVRRVLLGSLAGLPACTLLYAVAPTLALSALAIVALGGFYLAALSSFMTIAQLRAPDNLRGRVLSLNSVLLGLLYPLGLLVQGFLADQIGLRPTLAGAALLLAGVLLLGRVLRPDATRALDDDAVLLPAVPALSP